MICINLELLPHPCYTIHEQHQSTTRKEQPDGAKDCLCSVLGPHGDPDGRRLECQPAHGRPRPDPHSRGAPGQFGEALFDQLFGDRRLYGRYQTALQAGVANLTFEIAGSPTFQRLHWEALKDPDRRNPLPCKRPLSGAICHPVP